VGPVADTPDGDPDAEADVDADAAGPAGGLPAAWRADPPVAVGDLAAWELRLTPAVGGVPTAEPVSLAPGDAFEVLSRLTPVPVDEAVVLDYLDTLKRAYYYKSPVLRERL